MTAPEGETRDPTMNRRLLARLAVLAVLAVLASLPACGGSHGGGTDTAGGGSCVASLAGGELVITEFMADPAGPDGDGIEWFEVHNPGGAAIDLEGIGLVFAEFLAVLEKNGLERIDALGSPFDPNEHEAVMQDDGDGDPVVGDVLRTGWKLKGRVVRPAMVKVTRP